MIAERNAPPVYRVTLTGEDLRALVFQALEAHLGPVAELNGTESIYIYIGEGSFFRDEEDDLEFSEANYVLESTCTGPKLRFVVPVDMQRVLQGPEAPVPPLAGARADRNPPGSGPGQP